MGYPLSNNDDQIFYLDWKRPDISSPTQHSKHPYTEYQVRTPPHKAHLCCWPSVVPFNNKNIKCYMNSASSNADELIPNELEMNTEDQELKEKTPCSFRSQMANPIWRQKPNQAIIQEFQTPKFWSTPHPQAPQPLVFDLLPLIFY